MMFDQTQKITIEEAYIAMYKFLEKEYELTGSDDIGGMLGGMSLLEDGSTADPAAWYDWLDALKKAHEKDVDIKLHISPEDSK